MQLSLAPNLDLYVQEASSSGTFKADLAVNTGTYAAPAYGSPFTSASMTSGVVLSAAFGIVADASGNAYTAGSAGLFKLTKNVGPPVSLSAGSAIPLPTVTNSTMYFHYAYLDGAGNVISPDNANGNTTSGIAVYDVADGGVALGTYKACYVVNKACGTGASGSPMFSPRGAAIDSAGDVWVVSGAAHTLTMLVGAAAPTWPALSMVKFGKPQ
jgi:hypothetical protein